MPFKTISCRQIEENEIGGVFVVLWPIVFWKCIKQMFCMYLPHKVMHDSPKCKLNLIEN